jgi:hypothetical protein
VDEDEPSHLDDPALARAALSAQEIAGGGGVIFARPGLCRVENHGWRIQGCMDNYDLAARGYQEEAEF